MLKECLQESWKKYGNSLQFVRDKYEALENAEGVILVTEWKEFKDVDFEKFREKVVVDGRNLWELQIVKRYAKAYESMGRGG